MGVIMPRTTAAKVVYFECSSKPTGKRAHRQCVTEKEKEKKKKKSIAFAS